MREKVPTEWESIRESLPLLSRNSCVLHKTIWSQGKPRSGWFGNARETIQYVDNVMNTYAYFKFALS